MEGHIEPSPKLVSSVERKDRWPVSSLFSASSLRLDDRLIFSEEITRRRTVRVCEPLDLDAVLSLLQFALKVRENGEGENMGRLRKLSISAGAMHPLEALVVSGPEVVDPIIYNDLDDVFGTVQYTEPEFAAMEVAKLFAIAPRANGHLLLLVANLRHIAQAYKEYQSLVWRDAGALLQTLSLLATAKNHAFVPLGPSGNALLGALAKPHANYVAVGTGIIGKIPIQAEGGSSQPSKWDQSSS